jgi:hypothetical protein
VTLEKARTGLWLSWGLLEFLKAQLQPLGQERSGSISIDFSLLDNMVERSKLLAVTSIQQLAQRLRTTNVSNGLLSNTTLMASQTSLLSSLRFHNVHNICENALSYRENKLTFHEAAIEIGMDGDVRIWECRRCNMKLSRAHRNVSSSNSDFVWVGPSALLKSHCSFQPGQPLGWTCIWKKVSRQCYLRFDSRRSLLKHLLQAHVIARVSGQATTVDWPEDLRPFSVDQCGYGITLGGRKMQNSVSSFIVPG